jgi:hypothetical protein
LWWCHSGVMYKKRHDGVRKLLSAREFRVGGVCSDEIFMCYILDPFLYRNEICTSKTPWNVAQFQEWISRMDILYEVWQKRFLKHFYKNGFLWVNIDITKLSLNVIVAVLREFERTNKWTNFAFSHIGWCLNYLFSGVLWYTGTIY